MANLSAAQITTALKQLVPDADWNAWVLHDGTWGFEQADDALPRIAILPTVDQINAQIASQGN